MFTEPTFCRNSSINISIGNRYYDRFINLGRPIFSLNHSGASAATVFTIPTTFGIAHAPCYTRAERATQSAAELDHRCLIFLLFRQPITSTKLYLPSVRSVVLVKTQLQSIQSSWETWFLPETSFGLRVLSSPASVCLSVCPCVCVCVSITCLSAR